MNELEALLRSGLKGEHSSLIINFNDHHASYEPVAEACESRGLNWVSEAEKDKAIATDSVWTIQWYPDTPVGFYRLAASSLEALLAAYAKEAA